LQDTSKPADGNWQEDTSLKEEERILAERLLAAIAQEPSDVTSSAELDLRQSPVSKARNFVCSECGKDWVYKYAFDQHYLGNKRCSGSHKKFVCPVQGCETGYTWKQELDMHITTKHQTDMYFRCTPCEMYFGTYAERTEHDTRVHGEV